ncbi:alpha/beta fold hydrolase [Actinomadura sp. HBU206391]|nr:alpha/beta fold hydrolase [Actinomadura sp. HBU206391]
MVRSADGTAIAYEHTGGGPALVLVDGAMCHRAAGPMRPLAALLQDRFTVYTYDRRGRGESSDTRPYAVAREVEDLRALIARAGGGAYVYATCSGAALALATAAAGLGPAKDHRCPGPGELRWQTRRVRLDDSPEWFPGTVSALIVHRCRGTAMPLVHHAPVGHVTELRHTHRRTADHSRSPPMRAPVAPARSRQRPEHT